MNVEPSSRGQSQHAALRNRKLSVVVEPPVRSTVLVDITPRSVNNRRIGGNKPILNESGDTLVDLKVAVSKCPKGPGLPIQDDIGKKEKPRLPHVDTGGGNIGLD